MREMVLNHASLAAPNLHTAFEWLKDLARGIPQLNGVAQPGLRMAIAVSEIWILPDCSLYDAYLKLLRHGARDAAVFLMGLSARYPLLCEVDSDFRDRFCGCETTQLSSEEGEPLLLCAITDWIAVGFPSNPIWDKDQLTVCFDELLPDGSLQETSETIDNLTRSKHARLICERHRARLLDQAPSATWEQRDGAFPNLVFGPDVEPPPEIIGMAIRRLAELDRAAAEWSEVGGHAPRWRCKVTRESESVRNNTRLLNERRFRSGRGTRELFEWHARIGSGFRIHLRFNAETREVEIGYIGPHLPL